MQEAMQKRIILWNEPNYEPGKEEELKFLLGGYSMNIKIKHSADGNLRCTPIIILSNRDVIPTHGAFSSRIKKYNWTSQYWLKNFNKKPLPSAVFYLFLKYRIFNIFDIDYSEEEKKLINY